MAENEQLKIEAELDTSQLKQEAKSGLQTVVNEEKKVETQSKQTSKAVDEIGTKGKAVGASLQQAGNQGTQALKQVGAEADKTAKRINEIAKATKDIKLKQGLGMVSSAITTLAPLGQAAGKELGLSDNTISVAGGLISGAASGAMLGSALGPIGAGIGAGVGALVGAGAALSEAAKMQKEAARGLMASAGVAAYSTIQKYNDTTYREETARRVEGYLSNPGSNGKLQNEVNGLIADLAEMRMQRASIAEDISTVTQWSGAGLSGSARVKFDNERSEKLNELSTAYEENEREIARFEERLKALQGVLKQINGANTNDASTWAEDFANAATEDFWKGVNGYQNEIKAEKAAEKAVDMNYKKQTQDAVKEYQSQLSAEQSYLGKLNNFRLSDSLTKMGSGGYGVQMQGINNYVRGISTNIDRIKAVMQKCLETIQSIDNKYSPYGGQFIAETDN